MTSSWTRTRLLGSASVIAMAVALVPHPAGAQQTVDDPPYIFGTEPPPSENTNGNPNLECVDGAYSAFANTTTAALAGTFAAASLSAVQASTTQITQKIAENRQQEKKQCPAGYSNVNGSCVPAQAQVSTPAPQSSAPTAAVAQQAPSSSAAASQPTPSQAPVSMTAGPEDFDQPFPYSGGPSNGVWAEGFYDYEDRTNLPDGQGGRFDREQHTSGFYVGGDRTFSRSGQSSITLGGLAGYTALRQDFGTSQSVDQTNTFDFDVEFLDTNGYGVDFTLLQDGGPFTLVTPASDAADALYSRTLSLDNPLTVLTSTKQRLDGANFAVYGSYERQNFFIDVVGKLDYFDLERETRTRTMGYRNLNLNLDEDDPDALTSSSRNGCLSVDLLGDNQMPNGFQAPDPQAPVSAIADPLTNYGVIDDKTTIVKSTLTSFTLASAIGNRYDIGKRSERLEGWWIEPVVGVRWTYASFGDNAEILGLEDGHAVRVRGGATVGKPVLLNRIERPMLWNVSLGAFLFSDVFIDGFVRNGAGFSPLAVEADEGKLRVEGVLRNELDFLNGTVAYTEVNVRGGEDLIGAGGKLGLRLEF